MMQRKQLGIASIEYALLTGLLVIAAVSGVVMIQNTQKGFFSNTLSQLGEVNPTASGNTSAIVIQNTAQNTTQQQNTTQPVISTSSHSTGVYGTGSIRTANSSMDFDDEATGRIELNQHATDITGSSTEMSTSDALLHVKHPRQIVADAAAAVNQSGLLFNWKPKPKKADKEDEAEIIESIQDISTQDVTQLGQF